MQVLDVKGEALKVGDRVRVGRGIEAETEVKKFGKPGVGLVRIDLGLDHLPYGMCWAEETNAGDYRCPDLTRIPDNQQIGEQEK